MEDNSILKELINQFVWANASGETTLDEAERIAIEIHKLLRPDDWAPNDSFVPGPPDPPRPEFRTEVG